MAKRKKEISIEPAQTPTRAHSHPQVKWQSFDHFWFACVKNGTPVLKASLEAQFKSLNIWNKSDLWVDATIKFGIPLEQ